MSRLGAHQLIDPKHLSTLRSLPTDAERVEYVDTVLDNLYDEGHGTDYDKAWSLLHSALQNSNPCSDFLTRSRCKPASWAIMGTEDIALTDQCLITAVGRWQIRLVDFDLRRLDSEKIRQRLVSLISKYRCERLSTEDADYAATWFPRLQSFYRQAAQLSLPAIFIGDLV